MLNCPYCNKKITKIEYWEWDQNQLFEHECHHCEKIFMVEYEIDPVFSVYKAPCKNGKQHKLQDIRGFPEAFYVGKKKCTYCGEIVMVDEKAHKEEIDNYNRK